MRTYTVSRGRTLLATVTVHDEGQLTWDFSPDEWHGRHMGAATKRAIEAAITLTPTAMTITVMGFTMCQRTLE